MIHNINNNDNDAFANVSSDSMIQTKGIGSAYNGIFDSSSSATTSAILLHPVSFSEDTLFPQTFESSATQTSDIMLANGATLPPRPTTLTVNKIQSNNTLVLSLHSLNDKYLLTDLKGPSKPAANSTADNAQFSLTGNITVNKSKSYSVIATLAESNTKQITLTITDAKTPNNFKATIDFSPPHAATPLAE
jgi:hypothetical protein